MLNGTSGAQIGSVTGSTSRLRGLHSRTSENGNKAFRYPLAVESSMYVVLLYEPDCKLRGGRFHIVFILSIVIAPICHKKLFNKKYFSFRVLSIHTKMEIS
jgi:hypothetical protein